MSIKIYSPQECPKCGDRWHGDDPCVLPPKEPAGKEAMKTIYISIGNSDNKLTQLQWSAFCNETETRLGCVAREWHFVGFSKPDAPWQTMCCCIVVANNSMNELRQQCKALAANYGQDSVALAVAEVEFWSWFEGTGRFFYATEYFGFVDRRGDYEQEKLASAAPEMCRALAALEWGGTSPLEEQCCPACGRLGPEERDYDERGFLGQHDDCALDAALTKAGLDTQEKRDAARARARMKKMGL